jgi:hypothetical protein
MTSPRRLIGRALLWFMQSASPTMLTLALPPDDPELADLRARVTAEQASAEAWFTHAKAWRDACAPYHPGAPAVDGGAL